MQKQQKPAINSFRITENAALFGLIVREQGELVKYVSYDEAHEHVKESQSNKSVKVENFMIVKG